MPSGPLPKDQLVPAIELVGVSVPVLGSVNVVTTAEHVTNAEHLFFKFPPGVCCGAPP